MKSAYLSLFLLLLPGCRAIDWSLRHFEQGEPRSNGKAEVRAAVRTARIYTDQYETVGLFDALYLSPQVRAAYVDAYIAKRGLGQSSKSKLLHEQNQDAKTRIDFYLAAYVPDHIIKPNEKEALWGVCLKYGDQYLQPRSIKAAELAAEYNYFLLGILSKHKTVYEVTFDAVLDDGKKLLSELNNLELVLATADRSTTLTWRL